MYANNLRAAALSIDEFSYELTAAALREQERAVTALRTPGGGRAGGRFGLRLVPRHQGQPQLPLPRHQGGGGDPLGGQPGRLSDIRGRH